MMILKYFSHLIIAPSVCTEMWEVYYGEKNGCNKVISRNEARKIIDQYNLKEVCRNQYGVIWAHK